MQTSKREFEQPLQVYRVLEWKSPVYPDRHSQLQ